MVSGLGAGGFTVTYSGAPLAGTDVPNFSFDNLQCHGCFAQVAETNHGGTLDSVHLSYGGGPDSAVITNGGTSPLPASRPPFRASARFRRWL